jgi:hypothetical protein
VIVGLLWIVRVLVELFVLRLVLHAFVRQPVRAARRRPTPAERSGGVLVRDPQCGTYLPQTRAITLRQGSGLQHFCSTACRDAWAHAHAK